MSFVYDSFGRRISKTVNGVTTQFLYDGDNVVKEIKVGGNAEVLTGGTDQIFSRTDAAGQRTMVADGLGSVLGLVDGAGNTTTSYTYDAFGGTTASGAESDNANQYTSRENDGTGLYFYRARYYSARFGRFVSEDPIRQAGSGINWFVYAGNSPTNFADPTGLKPRKDQGCPPIRMSGFGLPQLYHIPNCRIELIAQHYETTKLVYSGIAAGALAVDGVAALSALGVITVPISVTAVAIATVVAAISTGMSWVFDAAATTLRHCQASGKDAEVFAANVTVAVPQLPPDSFFVTTPIAWCK